MTLAKNVGVASTSRVHCELIRGLIGTGICPSSSELAERLEVPVTEIERLLCELAQMHGVVLHPHTCEAWLVHPFSTIPTAHWIEGPGRGWWAPCIWCAFGISTLVGGATRIHSRIGAEEQPCVIPVLNGEPAGSEDLWVHFAIPPALAWQNVHQHCAMVLPFREPADILTWCEGHRLPYGEAVPLRQVARLAGLWYGTHAHADWHKWTITEAQEIFRRSGLTSPFWNLGEKAGRY